MDNLFKGVDNLGMKMVNVGFSTRFPPDFHRFSTGGWVVLRSSYGWANNTGKSSTIRSILGGKLLTDVVSEHNGYYQTLKTLDKLGSGKNGGKWNAPVGWNCGR